MAIEDGDEDEDELEEFVPEEHVHMEDCICEHPPEAHGWGHCEVEGCPCEGGWTE